MIKICKISNCCKNVEKENSICSMHRARFKRHGSYELPKKLMLPNGIYKICRNHGSLTLHQVYTEIAPSGNKIYICKICKLQRCQKYLAKDPLKISEKRKLYEQKRKRKENYTELRDTAVFKNYLRSKFGITLDQYESMVKEQKNLCLICNGIEKDKKKKRLTIDHCHSTNKVRGLLCSACHTLLGMAKDNIEILQAAIEYLCLSRGH